MNAQSLAIGCCVLLLAAVLELIRRRRLSEEYAVVWTCTAVALVALSLARPQVDRVAITLGIHYGPTLLLLMLGFFVAAAGLHFSLVVSRQRRQIERLIEDLALLEMRLREIEDSMAPPAYQARSRR